MLTPLLCSCSSGCSAEDPAPDANTSDAAADVCRVDAYPNSAMGVDGGPLRPVDVGTAGRDVGATAEDADTTGVADVSDVETSDGDASRDTLGRDCDGWRQAVRDEIDSTGDWPIPDTEFGDRVELYADLKSVGLIGVEEANRLHLCADQWMEAHATRVAKYLWLGIDATSSEGTRNSLAATLQNLYVPEALPYIEEVALLPLPDSAGSYHESYRYHLGIVGQLLDYYRRFGWPRAVLALEAIFHRQDSNRLQYRAAEFLNKFVGYTLAQLTALADDAETRRIVRRLRCGDRPPHKFPPPQF